MTRNATDQESGESRPLEPPAAVVSLELFIDEGGDEDRNVEICFDGDTAIRVQGELYAADLELLSEVHAAVRRWRKTR